MIAVIHPIMGTTTESKRRSIYVHVGVFTPLATLIVTARLYIRIAAGKGGWDDFLISISWTFATIHSILLIYETKHGMGMHIQDVPFEDFEKLMKAFYVILIAYTIAIGCFKMSVLMQYLRIFREKTFRHICYMSLTVVFLFTASFCFVAIFQCRPLNFFWARNIPGGVCLEPAAVWVTMNSINIATDFFIFFLPLSQLYKLSLPGRMKIALMIVFALGFFVVLMSIIRLPSVYQICKVLDLTWYLPSSAIWTVIELNTAVICASMPSLHILGITVVQRFLNTARRIRTLTTSTAVSRSEYANPSPITPSSRSNKPINRAAMAEKRDDMAVEPSLEIIY